MTGKTDSKSSQIVNKLIGLKEALDDVCRDMETEIDRNGNENNELRSRLRRIETQPKTVFTEDTEALKSLEREVENLRRENRALKDKDNSFKSEFQRAEQENKKLYEQLDRIKENSTRLLQ